MKPLHNICACGQGPRAALEPKGTGCYECGQPKSYASSSKACGVSPLCGVTSSSTTTDSRGIALKQPELVIPFANQVWYQGVRRRIIAASHSCGTTASRLRTLDHTR
mmetsp:Transcript_4657/g.12404  ORF Transcript_4657/g.12404 Transcript_4657/m.12404 type:complete len:107 (-) Transcript_4657:579-899(-)